MRVLIDGEAFFRHSRSGISRYFTELVREDRRNPDYDVEAVTPYRFVANRHLTEALSPAYLRVPLPGRWRSPFFHAVNRPPLAKAAGAVDLVHHTLYEQAALSIAPGVPRVCTVYDFTYELHADLFPGNTEIAGLVAQKNDFMTHCDGLLCISEMTCRDLHTVRPDLDVPVEVTPLGVSDSFFTPPARRPRGIPERYLLHVGNRHAHKNVDQLFRAFASLMGTDPDLHLVLCGNSLPDEQARRAELGIEDRTVCLRIGDDELPALYAHAIAFVFPSRYEGFGLPVVEAMAAGCPVLMCDVPALLEVAGGLARTFDPEDDASLVALLDEVLGDATLRTSMAVAGRTRACDFTWQRTAMATAEAYRRVLGQR